MLKLMQGVIQGVMQGGGVGTPQQAHGLDGAAMYVEAYIKMLEQDKAQKERVTAYSKMLGKLMNMVKAMHQRQEQAAKAKQGEDQQEAQRKQQEAQQALQMKAAEGQLTLKTKDAAAKQKLTHKEMDFQAAQKRKNLESLGQVQRDSMMGTVKAHGEASKAEAAAEAARNKPQSRE
jgi:hypothetical protein